MKNLTKLVLALLLISLFSLANAEPVGITAELSSVEVMHNGKAVTISRNQDNKNTIAADYALTSRPAHDL